MFAASFVRNKSYVICRQGHSGFAFITENSCFQFSLDAGLRAATIRVRQRQKGTVADNSFQQSDISLVVVRFGGVLPQLACN
jgi:hypothetical protein